MYACPKVSLDKSQPRGVLGGTLSNLATTPSVGLLRSLSAQAPNLQASHYETSVKRSYENGEVE
jgi:hypothetical protein